MNTEKRRCGRVQGGWAPSTNEKQDLLRGRSRSGPQKTGQADSTVNFVYEASESRRRVASMQPANFSWIVDGLLAGSSFPSRPGHFEFFRDQGIKTVVTLTEWKIPSGVIPPGIKVIFLPVVEFEPPRLEQVINFVRIVDSAKASEERVVCHCHWGRGRTGTMLAAFLVARGHLQPRDAIEQVRAARPHSVETYEQENVVYEYGGYLQHQRQRREEEDACDSASAACEEWT